MNNTSQTLGRAVSGLFRSLAQFASTLADSFDTVVDFATVRVFGLPFIVLGYRGTGKTTLIARLRKNLADLEGWDPNPTAAGGDPVPAFSAAVGADGAGMKLKPRRDVGGEYAMWEADWIALFRETKPRGIIFLIDHTNPYQHKDALNFVLQMLDEEAAVRRPLKAFLLLANKADLWPQEVTLDALLEEYRNEIRRLKSQSERLGYECLVRQSSLLTGEGIDEALVTFFDAVRPRPQQDEGEEAAPPARSNGRRRR